MLMEEEAFLASLQLIWDHLSLIPVLFGGVSLRTLLPPLWTLAQTDIFGRVGDICTGGGCPFCPPNPPGVVGVYEQRSSPIIK